MLRTLCLQDFVIVKSSTIRFGAGLTSLTGETGAGKSILLDALGLILGGRTDPALVRDQCTRADIRAGFSLNPAARAWLEANDWSLAPPAPTDGKPHASDEPVLLVRRTLERDGRSRAWINGRAATRTQLRALGTLLIDIHGQHEAQILMKPSAQRDWLDHLGQLGADRQAVADTWRQWQAAIEERDQARLRQEADQQRIEQLDAEMAAVQALQLQPDEWAQLSAEQHRLAHARTLLEGAEAVAGALHHGDDTLADQLRGLGQKIAGLAQLDERLQPVLEMLETARIHAIEAAGELQSYTRHLDLDPEHLEQVDQRLGQIFTAARRLRIAPEALYGHLAQCERERNALAQAAPLTEREQAVERLKAQFHAEADRLSRQRQACAEALAEGATQELRQLGMPEVTLAIACRPTDAGPAGCDQIEFMVSPLHGSPFRSVSRTASGGELSRIGLAIAVTAARFQTEPAATLIFDEADTGLGGATAHVVGDLLHRMGRHRQVLCVTHLAQVAARADHHLQVTKSSQGTPDSTVTPLDAEGRVREIARMMGAQSITASSRAHAEEVMRLARPSAAPPPQSVAA